MRKMLAGCLGLAMASMSSAAPVEAPAGVVPTTATHHRLQAGARSLPYLATFGQHVLKGADGLPAATLSTTSYELEGSDAGAGRPVFFLFNGGPGASSSPLQFGAMGPRLRTDAGTMVDNPDSPLDRADLVFVDPVGTGFSRALPGRDPHPFWSIEGDAAATLEAIRAWLAEHHRERSPVFIGGESYGGARLAAMLPAAGDLDLRGLLFVSPSLLLAPSPDLGAILALPSMAVAAAANGKRGPHPPANAALFDEATRFAQGDYAHALLRGSALPATEERRVAERLAVLVGLPVPFLLAHHLRVDPELFRAEVRRADGLVVGRLDTRITAPIAKGQAPGRPSAANDPALGLGHGNVIVSKAIGDYYRDELKVPTREDFIALSLDVNFQWRWPPIEGQSPAIDPAGDLATAMKQRPALRATVVGGYYDLAVPLLEVRYAIDRTWLPRDRVTVAALDAGHSAFEGEGGRRSMRALVDALLDGR